MHLVTFVGQGLFLTPLPKPRPAAESTDNNFPNTQYTVYMGVRTRGPNVCKLKKIEVGAGLRLDSFPYL